MGIFGKTLRFTFGILLGAGIGAAAALVVAPQSGRVTKEQIQARINDALGAAKSAQRDRERELQDYWEQEIDIRNQRKEDEKEEKK